MMDDTDDKLLDDDDIIDLTDLLEEDATVKTEKEPHVSPRKVTEPDSFDLGRELSLDYDVSVEELETESEKVDVEVALSPGEESALSPETPVQEAQEIPQEPEPSPEQGSPLKEEEPTQQWQEPTQQWQEPTQQRQEPTPGVSEPVDHQQPPEEVEIMRERDETLFPGDAAGEQEPSEIRYAPDQVEAAKRELVLDQALAEIKDDMPEILREMITPLMAELVKEIMSTTREQLPQIVEKVIREEIARLKKLDT
ncbi:MAG: hypothetical protein RRA35_00445 [Desulfomonilia bacterium]|nr:hypothetical protein [Desulfomonilia bacterium]